MTPFRMSSKFTFGTTWVQAEAFRVGPDVAVNVYRLQAVGDPIAVATLRLTSSAARSLMDQLSDCVSKLEAEVK